MATKADKLAKTRVKEHVRNVAAKFKTGEGNVVAFSSETGSGKEEILALLDGIVERASSSDREVAE